MKTPRLLLMAVCVSLATTAQASSPISLQGWTVRAANLTTDSLLPGAAYTEGAVYCKHPTMAEALALPIHRTPLLGGAEGTIDCVVLGPAKSKADPKVGSLLFAGKAEIRSRLSKGPVISKPGSSGPYYSYFTVLRIIGKVPYADKLVLLSQAAPTNPYTSYADGSAVPAPAKRRRTKTPEAPVVVKLSDQELVWLDKSQAAKYAAKLPIDPSALGAHVDSFRENIVENMDPNKDAIEKYQNAVKASKGIDEALPEIWGGKDNKAIVELSGAKDDVQLSPADFEALGKLPKAGDATPQSAYIAIRANADGMRKQGEFSAKNYDPIVLHRSVMTALKALGKTVKEPVKGPAETKPGAILDPLSKEDLALLGIADQEKYALHLKTAGGDHKKQIVQDTIKALRTKIVEENRAKLAEDYTASKTAPKNIDDFKKLPPWLQERFCKDYPVPVTVFSKDKAGGEIDTTAIAQTGLINTNAGNAPQDQAGAKRSAQAEQKDGAKDDKWPQDACRKNTPDVATTINPTGPKKPTVEGEVANLINNKPTGADDANTKVPDTVANSWFMKGQIQTFVKGSLIGLVIGSLFGPIGLILGPLIGGALLYGMQKYDAVKADKDSKKQPGD